MDVDDHGSHAAHPGGCSVASCLPAGAFPSTRDQLLVTLVRHRAKSPLLWELSRLPEGRTYENAAQVDEALIESRRVTTPREPW